jgi:hypothetical protein
MRYGNDPAKLARYRAFWNRDAVSRPLIGFTLAGWFPLAEFSPCAAWRSERYLTPDMVEPEAFLADHLRLLAEGDAINDDLIRGASPAQLAFPWLPGILGRPLRILPSTVVGEETRLEWESALALGLDESSPWLQKYLAFAEVLVRVSGGDFPVSHGSEIGPTDLHALLRGHTQSLIDLIDEPERSARLLARLGEIFCAATDAVWRRLPLFHGGYFDAQYSLWAPGPIVRMQEDASAVYSPSLYRRFVQPVDRAIARRYACSFIHLHSTSLFLLDAFLEVEEIRCFEVNRDALGPDVAAMLPYLRRIQGAGRPLLLKGALTLDEMKCALDSLDPRGLFLNIMAESLEAADELRGAAGI